MKKLALFIFALSSVATTSPISLKTDSVLQDVLTKFNTAYKNLKGVRKNIRVDRRTSYSYTWGGDSTTTVEYNYLFGNTQAEETFLDYKSAFGSLGAKLGQNALGDGFIVGAAVACYNKALDGETLNEKAIISTLIGALCMIAYQNNQMSSTPYYSLPDLDHSENLFSSINMITLSRATLALMSSAVSYFGTDYVLGRISDYKSQQ